MLWLRCRKIGRLIEELRIKNFLVFVFVVCVVFVVFVVSARFEIRCKGTAFARESLPQNAAKCTLITFVSFVTFVT